MKQLIIFVLVCFLNCHGFAQSTIDLADQCFDNGDYSCAIAKYNESLKTFKNIDRNDLIIKIKQSTECAELIKAGNKEFTNKNYVIAKENYEKVLESNPKDPYAKMQIKIIKGILFIPTKLPTKIIGNLEKCKTPLNIETYILEGIKLGSEDKFWRLFENEKEIRRFTGDTLRLSPSKTTKYRVTAENDLDKFFDFEIIVNQPPVITGSIEGEGIVCPGKSFSLKVNGFNEKENGTLNWYKTDAANKTRKFVGSGLQISDAISSNSNYEVEAINKGCASQNKLYKSVSIINDPSYPVIGDAVIKGNASQKADVAVKSYQDDKLEYEWSTDNFKTILSRGTSIKGLKLNKGSNTVYVRAVNTCGTSSYVAEKTIFRPKPGYFFMNFGVVSNNVENPPTGMVTLGGRGIYLRAKFDPNKLSGDQSPSTSFSNQNLEINNDGKVINYPPSTGYYYTVNDQFEKSRTGLTGGTHFGGRKLRFYLGGGYGERNTFWNLNLTSYASTGQSSSVFAKNIDQSWKGIEAEGGLFLKLGYFNIMGGASAIFDSKQSSPFIDLHLGIGFSTR